MELTVPSAQTEVTVPMESRPRVQSGRIRTPRGLRFVTSAQHHHRQPMVPDQLCARVLVDMLLVVFPQISTARFARQTTIALVPTYLPRHALTTSSLFQVHLARLPANALSTPQTTAPRAYATVVTTELSTHRRL